LHSPNITLFFAFDLTSHRQAALLSQHHIGVNFQQKVTLVVEVHENVKVLDVTFRLVQFNARELEASYLWKLAAEVEFAYLKEI
jgi:hypothetical protein